MEVEPCQGCSANKKVWERIQKAIWKTLAIWKQLQTHFKTNREKRCGDAVPTRSRRTTPLNYIL